MEARLLPGRRRKRSFAVLLGAALAAAVVVYAARGPAVGALAAVRFSAAHRSPSTAHQAAGATPLAGREARTYAPADVGDTPEDRVAQLDTHAARGAAQARSGAVTMVEGLEHIGTTLAFADQAGTLAGALFPASLPPYLAFLYFLNQDRNGLSPTARAGFTSLLGFVTATVVTSIASKSEYGLNLADCDYLHAGAEQLLTYTNIANVIGLKLTLDSFTQAGGTTPTPSDAEKSLVLPAIGAAALVSLGITAAAAGGGDFAAHTAFLGGIGNLPADLIAEPANALSLPTWVIHVSSLLEWLVAMGLVWRIGTVSGNPKWKGLTWAMIPSHSSGVCACVYHLFYNAPSVKYVVLLQAALTLLGNCTLAFAAWRLASSNGWSFQLPGGEDAAQAEQPPADAPAESPAAAAAPSSAAVDASGGDALGLLTIFGWSVAGSYFIKYASALVTSVAPEEAAVVVPVLAGVMIATATGFNCWKWQQRSQEDADFVGFI